MKQNHEKNPQENITLQPESQLLSYIFTLTNDQEQKRIITQVRDCEFSHEQNRLIYQLITETYDITASLSNEILDYKIKTSAKFKRINSTYLNQIIQQKVSKEDFFQQYFLNNKIAKTQEQIHSIKAEYSKINFTKPQPEQIHSLAFKLLDFTNKKDNTEITNQELCQQYLDYYQDKSYQDIQKILNDTTFSTNNYSLLNEKLGPISNTDLIIYGGKTGGGKSALSLNLLFEYADSYYQKNQKYPYMLFFSYEMSKKEIFDRMIAIYTGINLTKIKTYDFPEDNDTLHNSERERMEKAIEDMKKYNFIFEMMPRNRGIDYLEIKANIIKNRYDLKMIFVDHIHIMTDPDNDLLERATSNITSRLKLLANDLETPVFALAQYTKKESTKKQPDENEDKFNSMEFKGGSGIAQNANIIFQIQTHTPSSRWDDNHHLFTEQFPRKIYKEHTKLSISKNRNGQSRIEIAFIFKKSNQKFIEIPRELQEISLAGDKEKAKEPDKVNNYRNQIPNNPTW
ncbi:DnaB-like helicase C-terminal domain-containing protein [Candidatus Phytoplasma pruni]|uniref:SF4 helicase domain-containing protein n=1 Tax=Candidatus Phytoplasma pruni TaxID=479893 RepID=A0A851HH97_9MOLU|nr:DnaB-like helicase C-terminal domain-containing protein [Candidatus Phytoplasma pruni]NWN45980.1 hypothetical protein [Candidatus Phytoplasma pruni]